MPNRKGFTLIELLVVIAIIGLLASIVLVSLNSARKKARDTKRLSDINQVNLAMELYYDSYGHYPDSTSNPSLGSGWDHLGDDSGVDAVLQNAGFMTKVPADPVNDGSTYYYFYDTVHNCTQVSGDPALLAVRNFEQANHPQANCPEVCGRSWNGYCIVYPDADTAN